jgi:hypothetical protein
MYQNKLKALDMKITAVQNYYVSVIMLDYLQKTHFSPSKKESASNAEDSYQGSVFGGDNRRISAERLNSNGNMHPKTV